MNQLSRRRVMFAVLALSYQLVFLHAIVMTVVAKDLMRDMGLNSAGMGLLGSAYLYAYAGMMLVSGMMAAWLGPRATLSSLFFISGTGGIIFSLSGAVHAAMLGRALCGVGLAATMTSAFTLFGRWYSAGSFARITSYFFTIGGLGALAGTGVMTKLNALWGWRNIFLGLAILSIVYSVLLFLTVRNWPPAGAAGTGTASSGRSSVSREDAGMSGMWRDTRRVVKRRDLWKLVLWFFSLPGIYFSFVGLWAIPFLKDVYGYSDNMIAALTSLPALGFIVGTPLIAWLSERIWHSYRVSAGGAGLVATGMMGLLLLWMDSLDAPALAAIFMGVGFSLNAPNACTYAAARNLFGTRMAGVTGGLFGCCSFIGGALTQILCGQLLDYAEALAWTPAEAYRLAFAPFLICGVLAALAGFTLAPEADGELRRR